MKKLSSILILAVFIWGCAGDGSHNHSSHEHHNHKPAEGSQAHHNKVQTGNVKTDKGEKWKANAETTEGIHKMIALTEENEQGRTSTTELRQSLDKEFNEILKKCTMTGEAHNQLHNYLLPLKTKYEELNENSGKETVEEIRDYLHTYGSYFE